MSLTFRFGFDGSRATSALARARARALDLRPALRSSGRLGVVQTRKRFVTKRAPDGSTWRPTDKPTGETMVLKGYLRNFLTDRPPTATSVEWGSTLRYAAMRQEGGVIRARDGGYLRFRVGANGGWVARREVRQHARPYLGINAADAAEHEQIFLRHVGEPLTGGEA